MDVEGGQRQRELKFAARYLFKPPKFNVLESCLRERRTEDEDGILKRMNRAREEFSCPPASGIYHRIILNGDLDVALGEPGTCIFGVPG